MHRKQWIFDLLIWEKCNTGLGYKIEVIEGMKFSLSYKTKISNLSWWLLHLDAGIISFLRLSWVKVYGRKEIIRFRECNFRKKIAEKWKKMLTEEIFDDIIDKHSRDGQTSQKQNSKKWKKLLTKKNGYDILIWLSQESGR